MVIYSYINAFIYYAVYLHGLISVLRVSSDTFGFRHHIIPELTILNRNDSIFPSKYRIVLLKTG